MVHDKDLRLMYLCVIGAVTALMVMAATQYAEYRVAVRSHNLDVFYKSLTCDDLPLGENQNVAACEQAIGEFMVRETGLFTR